MAGGLLGRARQGRAEQGREGQRAPGVFPSGSSKSNPYTPSRTASSVRVPSSPPRARCPTLALGAQKATREMFIGALSQMFIGALSQMFIGALSRGLEQPPPPPPSETAERQAAAPQPHHEGDRYGGKQCLALLCLLFP